MILYASFEDVMRLPEFEGYSVVDMLSLNTDQKVKDLFYPYGWDKEKPLTVQACLHRRKFDKKTTVNFRYVGEERKDKHWIESGRSSMEVRINRHSNDPTLIGELSVMCDMFRQSRDNVAMICEAAESLARKNRRKDIIIPLDYEIEMQQTIEKIKALQILQKSVRGYLDSAENILFDLLTEDERLELDDVTDNRNHPEYKEWLEQQEKENKID